MKNCLYCGKEVPQTEGRRERKFCDASCRQKKWQKDAAELRKQAQKEDNNNQAADEIKAKIKPPEKKKELSATEPKIGSMGYYLKYGKYE